MARKAIKPPKTRKWKKIVKKGLLVAFGVYLSFLALKFSKKYSFEVKLKSSEVSQPKNSTVEVASVAEIRPKYWFYMARGYMWIFFSVDNVLQKLGLEKIEISVNKKETVHNDWDLLWSYDYHNEIPINYTQLKYHQKINHIPGNYVLCLKDNLAVNTDSKYIPKAFNNSKSIAAYAEQHPEARFVQKLWSNRGVQLKNASEINFDLFGPGYKYFAQLYIENPLLIEGHKFDFGIYVVITSIDPLRVYYYEKNTLIRLCVDKYDPTNYENVDSYVISDACLFPWDIDALSIYYNNSYTYKESMNAYFTKKGIEMSRVWSQVEDCIRSIVLSKEESLIYWTNQYVFKYSFFELYRFDFILDQDLNLNLIEVNQSPNINPSEKLYRDRRMFENLLFNTFTLLGIGSYVKRKSFEFGDQLEEQMICHEEALTVKPVTCINRPCNETCDIEECELCWNCLSRNERYDRHLAYRETKNRGAMKRVFPPPKIDYETLGDEYLSTLSSANRKMTKWYLEMCKKDADFC